MRSLLKIQIIALLIAFLFLLLTTHSVANRVSQLDHRPYLVMQDEEEPIKTGAELIPVYFGMQENRGLSPQMPEEGSRDSVANCPKGFIPAWWSIRKRRGSTEWRDVGTWETPTVNKALRAQGVVKFQIWVTFSGSGTPTASDFEFNWLRNDILIAQAVVEDVGLTSGMQPLMIDVATNLRNQTPFESGDVFKLFIRCRISLSGAQILYGSRDHFSAVVMECDPLQIIDVRACQHQVKGIYHDIFHVKPNLMTFIAKVDEIELATIPMIEQERINEQSFQSANWEASLEVGNYQIEVGVSYMGNDNSTIVSLLKEISIKLPPEPTLFGLPLWLAYLIIGLVVLAIVGAVAAKVYSMHQDRKYFKQMEGKY